MESKTYTPQHYNSEIEPVEFIVVNQLPFCEGNVVKYISRHKLKNGADDVLKAIHYCIYVLDFYYDIHRDDVQERITRMLNNYGSNKIKTQK